MAEGKGNIVLFPFMAQGHIIPFLALAFRLSKEKGYEITMVNTPLNIKKLQSHIPQDSHIHLIEIPFNSLDYGLPPNCESTENLPLHLFGLFMFASKSLRPAFTHIISNLVAENNGSPPICVISDMIFGWSAEIAHDFGLFHAIFNAGGGYGMALYHSMWLDLPHMKLSSQEEALSLPFFPQGYKLGFDDLPASLKMGDIKGPHEFMVEMFQDWEETDAMLFNTVEEIDQLGLDYFRKRFSFHVKAIGPVTSGTSVRFNSATRTCMQWLDSKPESSVLYIAFGSQHRLSETQTMELAMALDTSNVSFIWVARPPWGFTTEDVEQWLPQGFLERTQNSEKGMVLLNWASQVDILSHESVGGFLTHCGWNSVMEALINGVPTLNWPMEIEQPFNAKFLEEEIGVGIRLVNGMEEEVEQEEIVEKIEWIMDKTKSKEIRNKACMVKKMVIKAKMNKGSSNKALDEFLDGMKNMI